MCLSTCLTLLACACSQVYNVSVSPFFGVQAPGPSPRMYGDLGINFSCSPANTHHLIEAAVAEVARLQVTYCSDMWKEVWKEMWKEMHSLIFYCVVRSTTHG